MALSIMCELLVIPEYLIAFLRLPSPTEWPDRLANICASAFAILLNGSLLTIAWGWERMAESCYTAGKIQRSDGYIYLMNIVPGSTTMMIFLVLDIIFIIFLSKLPNQENHEGNRTWGPFNKLQKIAIGGGIAAEVILTIQLVRLLLGLYSVAGPEQMSWGFGQIAAIGAATLGTVSSFLKYSFQICTIGNQEMIRAKYWCKKICSSFINVCS
jgi:hypothetical protein